MEGENHDKFSLNDVLYVERGQKNIFKVSWKMTNMCPYSCSYCYMSNAVEKAKASKDNPTQEYLESMASNIDEYVSTHAKPEQSVELHLIGGEVSMFDLERILAKLTRLTRVIIATNLYRSLDYWLSLKEYCHSRGARLGLSASFHLGMLDEKGRDDFCKKVEALQCQTKAVVNNENLPIYKPYFDRIMKAGNQLEITVERKGDNSTVELTTENQEYVDLIREYQATCYYKKHSKGYYIIHLKDGSTHQYTSNISLINNIEEGILDLTGFYCNAGENNIRINQSGQLLRSACRLCSMYFKVGNIMDKSSWHSSEELSKPIICKCTERGKDGKFQHKGCTCFNNHEMWQQGYDKETGLFDETVPVIVPDYWTPVYGNKEEKDEK